MIDHTTENGTTSEPTVPVVDPGTTHRYEAPASPPPPPSTPGGTDSRRFPQGFALTMVAALVAGAVGGAGGYLLADTADGSSPATTRASDRVISQVGTASAPEGDVEKVAAAVLPSVVKINVTGQQEAGSGSGIIISSDGEILTNDHVVEVAGTDGEITVNFNDGTTVRARIVGTDPVTDIAVIQAQGVSGLTPATLGASGDLAVGEQVVAIGSPFGLEATVTSGIVSALNRPVTASGSGSETTYPAIQTDAAINPGNSGGPLVNMAGQVVGINSSIRTDSGGLAEGGSIGLGFAIPLDQILPIVDQLRSGETPTHAKLGVKVTDASSDGGLLTGAHIEEVVTSSAADSAGLETGDVITGVDGAQITSSDSLVATIRGYRPGDTVELTVIRGGKTLTITATLNSDADGSQ